MPISSQGAFLVQGVGTHESCGVDTGSCAPVLTIYWVKTAVCTTTCHPGICATHLTITSSWAVSGGYRHGNKRATLETSAASPFNHRETQAMLTPCSQNSVGRHPKHHGGNTSISRRYFHRHGAFSTRGSQHSGCGRRGVEYIHVMPYPPDQSKPPRVTST